MRARDDDAAGVAGAGLRHHVVRADLLGAGGERDGGGRSRARGQQVAVGPADPERGHGARRAKGGPRQRAVLGVRDHHRHRACVGRDLHLLPEGARPAADQHHGSPRTVGVVGRLAAGGRVLVEDDEWPADPVGCGGGEPERPGDHGGTPDRQPLVARRVGADDDLGHAHVEPRRSQRPGHVVGARVEPGAADGPVAAVRVGDPLEFFEVAVRPVAGGGGDEACGQPGVGLCGVRGRCGRCAARRERRRGEGGPEQSAHTVHDPSVPRSRGRCPVYVDPDDPATRGGVWR